MKFHVMTLFPEMIMQNARSSILGRAMENGLISLEAVNIRDYTVNKHKKVDDYPYGGGAGMLMQAQPVYDCYQAVRKNIGHAGVQRVIYLTPQGKTFDQRMAKELAAEEELIFLCGHYEGIDERVLEEIVTDHVSIGDYVLTGGELPAMVMIDAIARLVPGVLHNEVSADFETFHNDLLEYPQYSRPEEWHGKKVPEVLLTGNHAKVEEWRLAQSEARTKEKRPDLYEKYLQKQNHIKRMLKKGKFLYMDMIESLRRGKGEIIAASGEGIIVCDAEAGTYMIAAFEEKGGDRIVASLPESDGIWQCVVHQEFLLAPLEKRFMIHEKTPFRQAVYTQHAALPVDKNIDIKPLDISYLDDVMSHYHMVQDKDYIEERLKSKNIYGAFVEEKLAGFAGVHQEGSLGLLEVYEEYRRKGIGRALEAFMINLHLSSGYTPYGDIVVGNEESIMLQEKMGLVLSKEVLYWIAMEEKEHVRLSC